MKRGACRCVIIAPAGPAKNKYIALVPEPIDDCITDDMKNKKNVSTAMNPPRLMAIRSNGLSIRIGTDTFS